jgi:hypothetical protein
VYLSTASGSSQDSLASTSSRDSPVCFDKVSNASGPIALFELGRDDWLVGARSDLGLRGFDMAALLKAVHEFAESTAQEPASTGTA